MKSRFYQKRLSKGLPVWPASGPVSMSGNKELSNFTFDGLSVGMNIDKLSALSISSGASQCDIQWAYLGEDPFVKSFVMACAISLCEAVSQIAKLEHLIDRARWPYHADPAYMQERSRRVHKIVDDYHSLTDQAVCRLLSSSSVLESTKIHEQLFGLLPKVLIDKACSLLCALTVDKVSIKSSNINEIWSTRFAISDTKVTLLCRQGMISVSLGKALLCTAGDKDTSPPRQELQFRL